MVKWIILGLVVVGLVFASWKKPRLTASIVWSLTATVLGTSAFILASPTDLRETLLWMSLATPLVWMLFIFWCHWDRRPYRPLLSMVSLTLVGAVLVFQLPTPVGG
ncbi:MAG: hypothetical protein AAF578_04910 [Pseudomonadota bacterium]